MKLPTDPAAYPDGWKPDPVTAKPAEWWMEAKDPDVFEPPAWDDDPAILAAWFGNFGFFETFRPIVRASCRAVIRAKNPTWTEARLDNEQLNHPNYIAFVMAGLKGREKYEQDVQTRGIGA